MGGPASLRHANLSPCTGGGGSFGDGGSGGDLSFTWERTGRSGTRCGQGRLETAWCHQGPKDGGGSQSMRQRLGSYGGRSFQHHTPRRSSGHSSGVVKHPVTRASRPARWKPGWVRRGTGDQAAERTAGQRPPRTDGSEGGVAPRRSRSTPTGQSSSTKGSLRKSGRGR